MPEPTVPQKMFGLPRYCWLPLLAFLGGSLVFIIVDLFCLLANHIIPHPGMNAFVRDVPR